MPLKIQTLSLNDSRPRSPHHSLIPKPQQVADDTVLLWKEEPSTESFTLPQLYAKLQERHPEWVINLTSFEKVLLDQNLYSNKKHKLNVYENQINFPDLTNESLYDLSNYKKLDLLIEVANTDCGRGLFAKRDFNQGDLIMHELAPLCIIPPMDKLKLMNLGKTCDLCGKNLLSSNISPHFVMMNGLDCNDCGAIWCSKNCRKKHFNIHAALKHNRYKFQKEINTKNWDKFEQYCVEKVFVAAYSIGVIVANILINKDTHLLKKFDLLASISQEIRIKSSDSTNIGGTFDSSSGVQTSEDPEPIWKKTYDLFIDTFPILLEDDTHPMNYDTFLNYIGRFNINQVSDQLYFLMSFINHNCEPNTHYEIDSKSELKLFARKPIKKGEELFITYVNPLHDMNLRRRALRVNWGFQCDCHRCESESVLPKYFVNESIATVVIDTDDTDDLNPSKIRRKSSMRSKRPDLTELLKNGKEFDLDIPENPGIGARRRTSVRFDGNVSMAVEEE